MRNIHKLLLVVIAIAYGCLSIFAQRVRIVNVISGEQIIEAALLDSIVINPTKQVVQPENPAPTVDLGLPSGTEWASTNIGADQPSDPGYFFAWGETTPKSEYSKDTYTWDNLSREDLINNGVIDKWGHITSEYDPATKYWGEDWCLPTTEDLQELVDNCKFEWTTVDGVIGQKVIGPNGKDIFFPASGYISGTEPSAKDMDGYFWTADIDTSSPDGNRAIAIKTFPGFFIRIPTNPEFGFCVRPIIKKKIVAEPGETIDLGLPSGIEWATTNIGADSPSAPGYFFAWGEIRPKLSYTDETYSLSGMTIDDMIAESVLDENGNLVPQFDPVTEYWGPDWCMPTYEDVQELTENCTFIESTVDGHKGYRVIGPNGNEIFLPSVGYIDGTTPNQQGDEGYYWTSTPDPNKGHFNPRDIAPFLMKLGYPYVILFNAPPYHGCTVRPVVREPVNHAQIATLHHNGNHRLFLGERAMSIAHLHAVDGDTITLSAGKFKAVNITKAITIIGRGWKTYTDEPTSIIEGDFTISTPASSGKIRMERFYHGDMIDYTSGTDIEFKGCRLERLGNDLYASNSNTRIYFRQSKVQNCLNVKENTSFICENSFIYDAHTAGNGWIDFNHSVLFNLSNEVYNCKFTNSIIDCCLTVTLDGSNSATYSLSIGGNCTACFDIIGNSTCQTIYGHDIFKTFRAWGFGDEEDYQLTDEAAQTYIGNDGTQIGMNGGRYPFDAE